MKKILKEDIEHLSELIRKANELINPQNDLEYLHDKSLRDTLYGKHPKCFIELPPIGRNIKPYMLPICNRHGIESPEVIDVALKLVQKLISDHGDKYDVNVLQGILNKLNHKHNVLIKTVPKPMNAAARKAKVTRMFGNIKKYLNMIK